ncbi:MAG TPA: STAS domain-containing protein [Candidatus Acidoferrales bacterium]|nr:STAS domain-containing protein [Candidatus Acidoferrales bacterium]
MSFKAHARELGDVAIIDASGSLTLGSGGTALRDLVHVLASKGQKKFLLNLREVDFIDSFGIGELARCYATVRMRGGQLKLVHLAQRVQDLLQITKLHTLFEIHTDEQTALGGFR